MSKINQVVIYLDVFNVEEAAEYYKTIFNFKAQPFNNELIRLEKDNCVLLLSQKAKPSITTFGLLVDDSLSLKKIIEQNGISHDYDSAKCEWQIKDSSGNTIVLLKS